MLILFVNEQVLIDNLKFVYFAFLSHLGSYLGVGLLVFGLLAEHNRTEYSLSKDIFSFSAIYLFEFLCVDSSLGDLLADLHHKIKVLFIDLVNLLCNLLFVDVRREIV